MVDKKILKNRLAKKEKGFLRVKRMTVERLKTFKGFELYSDQDAKQTIEAMERLARVLNRHIKKQK